MFDWLLYMILIGGLLTLAAHCVGRVCQLLERPSRWVWFSALLLTVVLAGVAPYRAAVFFPTLPTRYTALLTSSEVRRPKLRLTGGWSKPVEFVRREMTAPTITIPAQRVPVSLDAYFTVVWATISVVVLLFFSTMYFRFRRVRRRWPISELHGVRVRIAPDCGPVVIGLLHPEIVIPQWLLSRSVEEQRVVLTHEQEHIQAGDPWVLAIACAIVALLPWHPLVWWMVSRLRLAIELDCDTRVLQRGVAPWTYGSLLIDLAEQCSDLPARALALAANRSHLKQRILAMKSLRPRLAIMQELFFGSSAAFFLFTAGIAQVPDKRVKTPTDSTSSFFSGTGWETSFSGDTSTKWIDFYKGGRQAAPNAVEFDKKCDSVLVLIDGGRQGVFPFDQRIPWNQLNLNPNDIASVNANQGSHWAAVNLKTWDYFEKNGGQESLMTMMNNDDSIGQWSHRVEYYPSLRPIKWTNLFRSFEHNRLRDSILVLVDGTQRGMFPINADISPDHLNLRSDDIKTFVMTSGQWAVKPYGVNAAHGVVNVITKDINLDKGVPSKPFHRADLRHAR